MQDFGIFLIGLLVGVFAFFIIIVVPFSTPNAAWQSWAIERGYALYCPDNGNFAWKGECKND